MRPSKGPDECAACRGDVCVWTESVVTPLHVTCTNNDGMEKPQPELGCCFQGGRENEGYRSQAPPPPFSLPPHPPPPPAPCTLQFRMGLCVYETSGFQGMVRAAEGKERQGWRAEGGGRGLVEGGGGAQAAAAYISQCTQRTGHLIYIEPHGSSCSVVFTVVHDSIRDNKMQLGLT